MTAVQQRPADAEPVVITEPGVYDGMRDADYHADPIPSGSLSSSGARRLLPPSCPALFRHEQLHGRPPKRTFDLGHAAHAVVLGVGAPLVVVDADSWRTKAAQEQRDQAHADGHTPLLTAEHQQVTDMAAALRQHPIAAQLLDPEHGSSEQSLFRIDDATGIWLRSRLDWLPTTGDGVMTIPDYKTAVSAAPDACAKAMGTYGYHQQAAWYADMATGLGLAEHAELVLIVQEKTAPYLVTVGQPDDEAVRIGRQKNHEAIATYAQCSSTGIWPGYTDQIELLALPAWATFGYDDLDVI